MKIRLWSLVLLLLLGATSGGVASAAANATRPFRLAFTSSMFSEVNESEARAAMKVWLMTVAKERGIEVEADPEIYRSAPALAQAHRQQPLDGFGLVTPEYARLRDQIATDCLIVGLRNGQATDEYLLVVHAASGIERLEQLAGRQLNLLQNPRMSLATIWLDTVLGEARLPRTTQFFGRVNTSNKATKTLLPVFFRQADAGLITRQSFELMVELNPQVGQQLRPLATSPAYLTSFFALHAASDYPQRDLIFAEIPRLSQTAAGRQILTLTQSERIARLPPSALDSALALLAQHDRLAAAPNPAPP